MPKLSIRTRIFITIFLFGIAILGFMIKLPSVFRGHDRMLHSLFYFLAAGFINVLFNVKNLFIHLAIFAALYFFGVTIEYAQQYSNTYFNARIHGRYDPEDIAWNLKGLLAFSAIWLLYTAVRFLFQKPGEIKGNTITTPTPTVIQPQIPDPKVNEVYLVSTSRATDLEATSDFYQKYFGFTQLTADHEQIQLVNGNLKLILQARPLDVNSSLHIQVKNIGALHADLSADKLPVDEPVYSSDNRLIRFRIVDPSGNTIRVSAF